MVLVSWFSLDSGIPDLDAQGQPSNPDHSIRLGMQFVRPS
jgi:hypothetical protein